MWSYFLVSFVSFLTGMFSLVAIVLLKPHWILYAVKRFFTKTVVSPPPPKKEFSKNKKKRPTLVPPSHPVKYE
jgi:hypothetical protein